MHWQCELIFGSHLQYFFSIVPFRVKLDDSMLLEEVLKTCVSHSTQCFPTLQPNLGIEKGVRTCEGST